MNEKVCIWDPFHNYGDTGFPSYQKLTKSTCREKARKTFVPRIRECLKQLVVSISRYFAANCKIALFNVLWDLPEQAGSSQNIHPVIKE